MISALQSARAGLGIATARFDDAATTIVRSGAAASEVAAGTASPATSVRAVGTAFSDPLPLFGDDVSLVSSLVDLKEAEILYKASATVFGAVADTQKSFLDITR